MAWEPKPGRPRLGQKRQQGTAIFCSDSNNDLNYELHREDTPFRAYENQRIPPLISQVPAKFRRTHMCLGIKSSYRLHKASRKSHLSLGQMKFQTDELHSIREELSQIKAQVDRLLQSLEQMEQQRDQHTGAQVPEDSSKGKELRGKQT